MRFIFVPFFCLEAAAPAAEGCDNALAFELAFDALPANDGADCGMNVGLSETAGLADVGEEVLDVHFHFRCRVLRVRVLVKAIDYGLHTRLPACTAV